ncbi:MAG: DUF349 domain-containing protein [Bacteroidales bacterium]|nr:DUF349 domain-containing protein [Bacteroidales bacterium]MBN2697886.1 DUF349 domain-containing protein [Bacteroidales bacterium]
MKHTENKINPLDDQNFISNNEEPESIENSEKEDQPVPDKESGKDTPDHSGQEEKQPSRSSDKEPEIDTGKESDSRDSGFVNDEEENSSNAVYDELDGETPGTEEATVHQEKKHEEEKINYELLSKEDIVKIFAEKIKSQDLEKIRIDIDDITEAFQKKHETELEEKKKRFLNEGGNIEDFKPFEDPAEKQMKELLDQYKSLKAEYNKQLEITKTQNLEKKNEILEAFRELMEGQDNFEKTFRKFKELQKRWFSVGIVPQQNVKDLWDNYNYFVDKFNDYVRINRELRALDLKKNLELKLQLCERTEKLNEQKSIINAFKTLQKYHTRWREIGPVPRENREEVWERFKNATAVINKKHQEYHSKLKEALQENLAKKIELCEKAEKIAALDYKNHADWAEKTNELIKLQKLWKSIGYAPKRENNAVYARFRRACDAFFDMKARFYAETFTKQQENLKLKLAIIEKAESLKESEDWKATTSEMIALQKKWKEIGPVPKRESDRLWKRFRLACDHFFSRKAHFFEDIDTTFTDNLKLKQDLIQEMEVFAVKSKSDENMRALEDFQKRFAEIGFVPNEMKDVIKNQFRDAQDRLLKRMGISEHDRSILNFKNRIGNILQSPRSEMKIRFERDKLVNRLQQLKSDIGVWENNIGFFKESKSSQDTINGFQEKIDEAHMRIKLLEEKIRILDDMENEN